MEINILLPYGMGMFLHYDGNRMGMVIRSWEWEGFDQKFILARL